MNDNKIIVHEFDTIICNEEYKDSKKYKVIDKTQFEKLMNFAKEILESADNYDASEFLKIGYRKGVKDTVTFNNYVGLIELPSGFQIEILPKVIFFDGESKEERTRKVFLRMLQSLKDFEGKSFTNAMLKADRMNLYEIFINMYINEAQTLIKHGLKSSYNLQEGNEHFYKGKLIVNQHLKSNLLHKERFYIAYDEYTRDRAENRIVKSTLLKLIKMSESEENKREIRKILPSFDMVNESMNFDKDFSEICIDRNTKDYEILMIWSRVFLRNESFSTFSGTTYSKALLFPMEKIFEKYVSKWVKHIFRGAGWHVNLQEKGYYLFDSPRQFSLRPDIVIRRNNITIILDTKWKILYPDARNYGISQADMYQMYAYIKKYMEPGEIIPEVWLLYPLSVKSAEIGEPVFCSNDKVRVHIYFVDVDKIEHSIHILLEKINKQIEANDFRFA